MVTLNVTGSGFFLILPTQQVTTTGSYQVPSGSLVVWGATYFKGSTDLTITGEYTPLYGESYTNAETANTMRYAFRVDSDCTINTAIL